MITRSILLFCAILLAATASAHQLNVLVFADFYSTSMTSDTFQTKLKSYSTTLETSVANTTISINVQNTEGDVLKALVALDKQLTADPTINVIIVADNESITQSLQGIISRKPAWSSILFISAFAASSTVCDMVANPSTVCLMPSAVSTLTAIFEASRSYLRWSSVAVIMSNDEYGRSVANILDKVSTSVASATIVSRKYMPYGSAISNTSDDAVIAETIQGRPVAVLLFVSPQEYTRILAAQKRNSAASNLFFLLSKTNVNVVKSFIGTATSTTAMTGAIFVPYYATADRLNVAADKTDEMGRLLLSYTFDSLLVAARTESLTQKAVMNEVYEGGITSADGVFSFDKNTGRRTYMQLGLIANSYGTSQPLLKYILLPTSATPIWDGSTNIIQTLVPASPLKAVTVCMASPPECSDVANLARLLSYTQQMNLEGSASASIVPIPINTGADGVSGLASFIDVAKQCAILTGPGRFAINNVFTPIINNYGITQIDYTTANPALSDLVAFPYFNRAIPSDTFNLKVLAATMDYFAWERVILLTTADTYGTAMAAAATDAMDERAILVEQLYTVDSMTAASLTPFFTKLRDTYIGRVVIPLLPVSDEQAALFIDTWASMNDKTTIFLFSNIFCQYLHSRPAQRLRVPSSICALPTFNQTSVDLTKAAYDASLPTVRTTLYNAGFENVDQCDLDSWGPYSVFALDAAKMLRQIVVNASTTGVVINTANMMPMIRGVTFKGVSSPFIITKQGDRASAEYNVDIQMYGTNANVTVFGYWDSQATPNFRYLLSNKNSITWLDGTTKYPAATIRSLTFIAQTTLTASPGTIVLSVLGFLGTFLVFGFCYRHYRTQRMLELDFDQMVQDLDRAQKKKREEAELSV